MKTNDQRIAIAEACGAKRFKRPWDGRVFLCTEAPTAKWEVTNSPVDVVNTDIPNFPGCLNTMHEAEKTLSESQQLDFEQHLRRIVGADAHGLAGHWEMIHATAAQRAEAFLKTKGLWTA